MNTRGRGLPVKMFINDIEASSDEVNCLKIQRNKTKQIQRNKTKCFHLDLIVVIFQMYVKKY